MFFLSKNSSFCLAFAMGRETPASTWETSHKAEQKEVRSIKKIYTSYSKLSEVKLLTIGIASPLRILQWAEKTLPNGKIYGEVLNANTLHHKTFKPQKGGLFCERIFGPLKDFECACGKIDKKHEVSITKRTKLRNSDLGLMGILNRKEKINWNNNSEAIYSSQGDNFATSRDNESGGTNSDLEAINEEIDNNSKRLLKSNRKYCPDCDVEYTWSVIRRYQLGYIKLNSPVTHIWFLKGTPSYLSILLDIKKRHLQNITYCSETTTLENSLLQSNILSFLESPSKIISSWKKLISNSPSLPLVQDFAGTSKRNKNATSISTPLSKEKQDPFGKGEKGLTTVFSPPLPLGLPIASATSFPLPRRGKGEKGGEAKKNSDRCREGTGNISFFFDADTVKKKKRLKWVNKRLKDLKKIGILKPARNWSLFDPFNITDKNARLMPCMKSSALSSNLGTQKENLLNENLLNENDVLLIKNGNLQSNRFNLMLKRNTLLSYSNNFFHSSVRREGENPIFRLSIDSASPSKKYSDYNGNGLGLLGDIWPGANSLKARDTQIREVHNVSMNRIELPKMIILNFLQSNYVYRSLISENIDLLPLVEAKQKLTEQNYRAGPLGYGTNLSSFFPNLTSSGFVSEDIYLLNEKTENSPILTTRTKNLPIDLYILCSLEHIYYKQALVLGIKKTWIKIYREAYLKAMSQAVKISNYWPLLAVFTLWAKDQRAKALPFPEGGKSFTPALRKGTGQFTKNFGLGRGSSQEIKSSLPLGLCREKLNKGIKNSLLLGFSETCRIETEKTIVNYMNLSLKKIKKSFSKHILLILKNLKEPVLSLDYLINVENSSIKTKSEISARFENIFMINIEPIREVLTRSFLKAFLLLNCLDLPQNIAFSFSSSLPSLPTGREGRDFAKNKKQKLTIPSPLPAFAGTGDDQIHWNLVGVKSDLFKNNNLSLKEWKYTTVSLWNKEQNKSELTFNYIQFYKMFLRLNQKSFIKLNPPCKGPKGGGGIGKSDIFDGIAWFENCFYNGLGSPGPNSPKRSGAKVKRTFLLNPKISLDHLFLNSNSSVSLGLPPKGRGRVRFFDEESTMAFATPFPVGERGGEAKQKSVHSSFLNERKEHENKTFDRIPIQKNVVTVYTLPLSSVFEFISKRATENVKEYKKILSFKSSSFPEGTLKMPSSLPLGLPPGGSVDFSKKNRTTPSFGKGAFATPFPFPRRGKGEKGGEATQKSGLCRDGRQNKIYNNIYALSHRERWNSEKDWRVFMLYNGGVSEYMDFPIYTYKHRIFSNWESPFLNSFKSIPPALRAFTGTGKEEWNSSKITFTLNYSLSSAFYSGAGIVQQLLNELNFEELKKLDKQNRLVLYQLNKSIIKVKKQAKVFVYDKNFKNELKELCKKREFLIRRTKLVRKFFRKDSDPSSMIITILPVLPPDLRPIVKMGNQIAASDLNRLYQRVIYRNDRLKKFLKDAATSHSYEMKYAQRLLQEAVDNLIQNGKSGLNSEKDSRGRILKSLSDLLKGKQGRFRQFLLGKRVDYSGRSVIVVGPKLKLYECGIPLEMAKELYLPFLLKTILNKNYARTVIGAKSLIQNNPALAHELLRDIMTVSPVFLNRAPTLHRLGIQAFIPKLVEGRAILLHPLVCAAFNADFDGDQMAVHVPITVEARAEAWKLMLARNNIFSPATGDPLAIPSQDMVLGCYFLTTYANKQDILQNWDLKSLTSVDCQLQKIWTSNPWNSDINLHQRPVPSQLLLGEAKQKSDNFSEKLELNPTVSQRGSSIKKETLLERSSKIFFNNLPDVLKAFNQQKISLHTFVWVKWNDLVENGSDQEEPIEIRISSTGQWQEICVNYHRVYTSNNILTNQYIVTTPGRILWNLLIQQILYGRGR